MAKSPKTTTKKNAIATKWFVQPDGSLSKYPTPETTALRFIFSDGVEIDSTRDDDGEGMEARYYWHGKSQKQGDSYAGAKTPEEARDGGEKCQGVITLQERAANGEWAKAREGGGVSRPSFVAAAVIAALEADGQTVDDERRAAIVGKLKTAEERKEALANPTIDAQYKEAAVERARVKAAKAAEVAGTTEADLSAF